MERDQGGPRDALSMRRLGPEQIRAIYRSRVHLDFPADEVKPLFVIEQAFGRGSYPCWGWFRGEALVGYAFCIQSGDRLLLDYFAVVPPLRDRGLGGRMLEELARELAQAGEVLLEAEDPDAAADPDDRAVRERRLAFYARHGVKDTGVKAVAWNVQYRILSLKGRLPDASRTERVYLELYGVLRPGARTEDHVRFL